MRAIRLLPPALVNTSSAEREDEPESTYLRAPCLLQVYALASWDGEIRFRRAFFSPLFALSPSARFFPSFSSPCRPSRSRPLAFLHAVPPGLLFSLFLAFVPSSTTRTTAPSCVTQGHRLARHLCRAYRTPVRERSVASGSATS